MSFRLLEPVVAPPVAGADRPKPEAENPQEFPQPEAPKTIRPDAPIIIGGATVEVAEELLEGF